MERDPAECMKQGVQSQLTAAPRDQNPHSSTSLERHPRPGSPARAAHQAAVGGDLCGSLAAEAAGPGPARLITLTHAHWQAGPVPRRRLVS
jgi:hypothetical protein